MNPDLTGVSESEQCAAIIVQYAVCGVQCTLEECRVGGQPGGVWQFPQEGGAEGGLGLAGHLGSHNNVVFN